MAIIVNIDVMLAKRKRDGIIGKAWNYHGKRIHPEKWKSQGGQDRDY